MTEAERSRGKRERRRARGECIDGCGRAAKRYARCAVCRARAAARLAEKRARLKGSEESCSTT